MDDDLRRFAEDPPAWGEIDPSSGAARILTDRFRLLFGPSATATLVCRPRLDPDEAPEAIHEVRSSPPRRPATERAQPALVVHAGARSRPILEQLGFQVAAEQEVLLDPATC